MRPELGTATCIACLGMITDEVSVRSWRAADPLTFGYGICSRCGTLNLLDDNDPSPFYDGYFSHVPRNVPQANRLLTTLGALGARGIRLFHKRPELIPKTVKPSWLWWFSGLSLRRASPMIDVGSGTGALLLHLSRFGFSNLLGLDPYLPETKIEYSSSVRVERRAISLDDRADVVFLNHSLEHSDLPVAELERIRTILSINGAIIVSIPVVDSEPYIRFGANLVSLDAPVHRWIPTVEGVSAVAERSGFRIDAMVRTNPDFLYWGSEAVARGLPMDRGSVAQALGIEYMLSLERSARLAQRNQGGNLTFRLRHVD